MPSFLTDTELLTAIKPRLGKSPNSGALASWESIAADANAEAYSTIVSVLSGRGFTTTEIANWDDGAIWQKKLAVCFFMREASLAGEEFPDRAIERQCQCEEKLKTVDVVVDGELVRPSGSARIGTGEFDTEDDIHTMDDVL